MTKQKPNGIIIEIFRSDNEDGFIYNLYENQSKQENCEEYDGGLCTGSLADALEMANSQAVV